MIHLKVREIEGKTEAYFDAETLARLGAVAGTVITIDESAIAVQAPDTETETDRQLILARQVMVDYRETLIALAQ